MAANALSLVFLVGAIVLTLCVKDIKQYLLHNIDMQVHFNLFLALLVTSALWLGMNAVHYVDMAVPDAIQNQVERNGGFGRDLLSTRPPSVSLVIVIQLITCTLHTVGHAWQQAFRVFRFGAVYCTVLPSISKVSPICACYARDCISTDSLLTS